MPYEITYMRSLKNDTNELIYKTERLTELENEFMVTRGKREGERELGSLGFTYTHCCNKNG